MGDGTVGRSAGQTTSTPTPGADYSLDKIKAENKRSFEQTMALNMLNKEGDRQKEGAAAVGAVRDDRLTGRVEIDAVHAVRRTGAISGRRGIHHGADRDRVRPLRVHREERRGPLQVLTGLQTDNVQLTITGDRVPHHGPAQASATDVRRAGNTAALTATL